MLARVCRSEKSVNILLEGLCDNQKLEMALDIFEAFQKSEMDLNTATYNISS